MISKINNGMTVLIPDEGKYLTNGETYSQKVYLGKHASPEDWWEVNAIPDQTENTDLIVDAAETAEPTLL